MLKWLLALLPIFLFACSPNNVSEDSSLKKYFDENNVTGTFGMYDNGHSTFNIYNVSRFSDSVYLPASTFKIVNSLIGIETGRVGDTNTIIPYDGAKHGRPECEKDMSMSTAFRLSCVQWYQQLARRITKDTMQHWLDTMGYARRYGKFSISNNLDTFWLDNSAKVTADEQLGLVKKLYFDQLPFLKRTQRLVRGMMLWESNANYQLSYKTGWGYSDAGHSIGWIVGWIEENKHPYFFSLLLDSPDPHYDMTTIRLKILKGILKQYGFFEGRK